MEPIRLSVNGKDYELQVKPSATLLEVLREDWADRHEGRLRRRASAGPAP